MLRGRVCEWVLETNNKKEYVQQIGLFNQIFASKEVQSRNN
jgi:hypothetical protein